MHSWPSKIGKTNVWHSFCISIKENKKSNWIAYSFLSLWDALSSFAVHINIDFSTTCTWMQHKVPLRQAPTAEERNIHTPVDPTKWHQNSWNSFLWYGNLVTTFTSQCGRNLTGCTQQMENIPTYGAFRHSYIYISCRNCVLGKLKHSLWLQ